MSDERTTSEAAEPPVEEREWEIGVVVEATAYVTVWAETLEEAKDYALAAWSTSDLRKPHVVQVISVTSPGQWS
jgi:hypothetical protein